MPSKHISPHILDLLSLHFDIKEPLKHLEIFIALKIFFQTKLPQFLQLQLEKHGFQISLHNSIFLFRETSASFTVFTRVRHHEMKVIPSPCGVHSRVVPPPAPRRHQNPWMFKFLI